MAIARFSLARRNGRPASAREQLEDCGARGLESEAIVAEGKKLAAMVEYAKGRVTKMFD
jgi:hypothetical protein